jgi:hypothetical protein
MNMTDYPERISISPVYRQKRDDDFYLVDRDAFPGKGAEYVRVDLIADAKVIEAAEELANAIDSDAPRRIAAALAAFRKAQEGRDD